MSAQAGHVKPTDRFGRGLGIGRVQVGFGFAGWRNPGLVETGFSVLSLSLGFGL